MKYYARFNNTDFIITELPTISDSSREVSFSDLEIDFRGYDEALLPIQYQEVKIIQIDNDLNESELFTGYVDTVNYPTFISDEQPFLLSISLLSPYAYASKRSVSFQINSIALNLAILTVLEPLIDDGFIIETNTLSEELMSEIFQLETVEKVMNFLASKFNFIWYIDKNKKIYLEDIDKLTGQSPVIIINNFNKCFLKSIKPTKTVIDYANRLNIKNVIMINGGQLIAPGTTLTQGETYNFKNPISISENTSFKLSRLSDVGPNYAYTLLIGTETTECYIKVDLDLKTITYSNNIGISGIDDNDLNKVALLILDSSDTTKVTGFKWAGSTVDLIGIGCFSQSILEPYQASYIDPEEISRIKEKTGTSGIVEKVIDLKGKYYLPNELQKYAVNLFGQNNSQTNEINCSFKGKIEDEEFMEVVNLLKITKVFQVDLPIFKISGRFIITEISTKYEMQSIELSIKARNYNLNENYIDIYRVAFTQDSEATLINKMITFYNQDEKTVLNKEIYVNGVRVDV